MSSTPAINAPRVILVLLSLMAAVHVGRALADGSLDDTIFSLFAFIPSRYSANPGLDWAAGGWPAELWSLITYMFLHGDWTHLLFNGLWLLAFGSAVAWRVGTVRFLLFSTCCGIAGVLVHLALHWGDPSPVIGASAAISGHMAAAIRFVFRANGPFGALGHPGAMARTVPLASIPETFQERRSLAFLAVWLFVNLGLGLGAATFGGESNVAWEAHIGGFAFGLFFFGIFDRVRPVRQFI